MPRSQKTSNPVAPPKVPGRNKKKVGKSGKPIKPTPSTRRHVARSPTSINLSGTLRDALARHAFERCRHFFLFVTTLRLLEVYHDDMKPKHGAPLSAVTAFRAKATEQIDSGHKLVSDHPSFDQDDEDMLEETATAFDKTDAAHYCNLGIAPDLYSRINASDQVERALYENLKAYAGNTCWLPKRVNIGTDRIIDVMHGRYALQLLSSPAPVCTAPLVGDYVRECTNNMLGYRRKLDQKGRNSAIVACADAYLAGYLLGGRDGKFSERVFRCVQDETLGWCEKIRKILVSAKPLTTTHLDESQQRVDRLRNRVIC